MNLLNKKSFSVEEKLVTLKVKAKCPFENLHNLNLFTLKFHPLDHTTEDGNRFRSLKYLKAVSHENFSYVIKKFIWTTPMRK